MFFALIVAWIVFTVLIKVVKMTVSNALIIAAIILLLQVGYGITPQDIFNNIIKLPQSLNSGGR